MQRERNGVSSPRVIGLSAFERLDEDGQVTDTSDGLLHDYGGTATPTPSSSSS